MENLLPPRKLNQDFIIFPEMCTAATGVGARVTVARDHEVRGGLLEK